MYRFQENYLDRLTRVDLGVTILNTGLALFAALELFFLRKSAFILFLANLIVAAAVLLYHILAKGWINAVGPTGGAWRCRGIRNRGDHRHVLSSPRTQRHPAVGRDFARALAY